MQSKKSAATANHQTELPGGTRHHITCPYVLYIYKCLFSEAIRILFLFLGNTIYCLAKLLWSTVLSLLALFYTLVMTLLSAGWATHSSSWPQVCSVSAAGCVGVGMRSHSCIHIIRQDCIFVSVGVCIVWQFSAGLKNVAASEANGKTLHCLVWKDHWNYR